MTFQVYTDPLTINCFKVLAGLEEMGVEYQHNFVNITKGEHKTEAYLEVHPHGTLPAAVDGDLHITESNVILQYAAEIVGAELMYPKDFKQRAEVNRWLLWEASTWFSVCYVFVTENVINKHMGKEPDLQALNAQTEKFHKGAAILEKRLGERKWLAGSNVTIADFVVATPMHLFPCLPLENYPNIRRWLSEDMEHLEGWKKAHVMFKERMTAVMKP